MSKKSFTFRNLLNGLISFFFVSVIIGVFLAVSFINDQKRSCQKLLEVDIAQAQSALEMIGNVETLKGLVGEIGLTPSSDVKKELKDKCDRLINDMSARMGLLQRIDDPDGNRMLKEVRKSLDVYSAGLNKAFAEHMQPATGHAGKENRESYGPAPSDQVFLQSRQLEESISQFLEYKRKSISTSGSVLDSSMSRMRGLVFVFGVFLFLFAGVVYFSILRFVYNQVGGEPGLIRDVTRKMTEGDLEIEFPENTKGIYEAMKKLVVTMKEVARNAETVAGGNFTIIPTLRSERDQLGLALQKMSGSLSDLQQVTQEISKGNFDLRLTVKGESDLVSMSINRMSESLMTSKIFNDEQNWLKDGLNRLSAELTGDQNLETLAGRAISFISRYVSAGRSVIYLYNENKQTLHLLGSYAFTERETLSNFYELGKGVVGQVALEKKPIILKPAPRDEAPITTGTTSVAPLCTYTYPILYEETLLGVIELASASSFSKNQVEFLEESNQIVASGIYTAIQRSKIGDLLARAQEAQREAEDKTRMVQESNARLEEQQQQIQQQSEELQQTNSQLEEQQQQLQQQSEELQQTNSQLEEQQQQLIQQTEELQQGNQQLRQAKDDLDVKARDLEQSNRYKSDFLANMSHELRTPLNSIILLSKMMQKNERGNLDKEDIKRSKVIHSAGDELLRLINDILDISKIEAGKTILSISEFSTEDLLTELMQYFSSMAKNKGLTYIMEDALKKRITSDKDKVAQVLRNFISNALKFTKTGGVTILVEESGDPTKPVKICVRDTGIGIDTEKHKLIFEAFQQVDSSISREFGGTGLGLTISQKLATLLHGEIQVKSELEKGSEFSLLLPVVLVPASGELHEIDANPRRIAAVHDGASPELIPQALTLSDDRKKIVPGDKVILIVEDDPSFSDIVAMVVNKMNMKVIRSVTAEEGIRLAQQYPIHGIILDLVLPDMNGVDFMRRLKSFKELRHIPVQIISGHEKNPELMRMGALNYLQKPVDQDQIQQAIQGILNFSEKNPKDLLIVEDNRNHRQALMELIKGQNIRIREAETEAQAVEELNRGIYDAVIIDLGLKSGDGMNICKYAREHQMKVPIIVYTGKQLSQEEEKNLKKLADRIIIKTVHSENRLMDELLLFLHQTQKEIPGPLAATDNVMKMKRLASRTVLVVDDDIKNVFVMSTALEEHGALVLDAQNGKEALEILEKKSVDLVLMDIMMPVMDGYTAIRRIRENAQWKNLPVIALTAKALKEDREKCIAAGANDYLPKPVDYDMLIGLAEAWCQKKM